MGKKHKKLKKKKSIMQISPQVMQINNVVADAPHITSATQPISKPATEMAPEPVREEFKYVRGDVKKILVLMAIIVLLLIGLYYLDIKTSYLANLGNWFYKILNIQAQ